MLGDNKRPDGTTLLPWARGETFGMGRDSTRHLYAESHLANTAATPGAAANQAAQQKTDKYCSLQSTHIFCPVAIETSGTWNAMAVDLVQEIGRRSTNVTEDSRETTFLFQRLSMALQQGNAVAFQNTMVTE